jgi:hypothetical protein
MGEKWAAGFFNMLQSCVQHGTDGFTSPPKEGMLRILSPEKFYGFGRVRTRDLPVCSAVPQPLRHRVPLRHAPPPNSMCQMGTIKKFHTGNPHTILQ